MPEYSIDALKAVLNARNGLARKNRYEVNIFAGNGKGAEVLNILCTDCSIPSITITSTDAGLTANKYKIATGYSYEPVTFKFMLPGSSSATGPKEFFDAWMRTLVISHKDNYILNYPDSYRQDVDIKQLNLQNEAIYHVKLIQAWPTSIDAMSLNNSSDEIQEISVTMEYRDIAIVNYFR